MNRNMGVGKMEIAEYGMTALSDNEINFVNGGLAPIILAPIVTYVYFKFINGVFEGVEHRARKQVERSAA